MERKMGMTEVGIALIGALAGALAASVMYVRHEDRRMKIETLRRFFAYRFEITGPEFSAVLNEILLVFSDSKIVIAAVDRFREERSDLNLIRVYRAMARAARVKHKDVSDVLFLTAFNARPKKEKLRA